MANEQDRVKLHPWERLDLPDAIKIVLSVQQNLRATTRGFWTGAADAVVSGFTMSAPSSTVLRISRAASQGLVGQEEASTFGLPLFSGETSRDVDMTLYSTGTLGVWVKITISDTSAANRAFWNEETGAEFTDLVDTRQALNWSVALAASSPGTEYQKIGTVVWDGSLASADITHERTMLFEADDDEVNDVDGISDFSRSTDRATNGLKTFMAFKNAALRQFQDIWSAHWNRDGNDGGHPWYIAPPAGLSLRSVENEITVGDGVTTFGHFDANHPDYAGDAAAAVQDAIDALGSNGGTVFIKAGTYTFSTSVVIPTNASDRIAIRGAGIGGTTLTWESGLKESEFFGWSPSASACLITISDMTLHYPGLIDHANAINVILTSLPTNGYVTEFRVERVSIEAYTAGSANRAHAGLYVLGTSTKRMRNLVVEDCYTLNLRNGFVLSNITGGFIRRTRFAETSSLGTHATLSDVQGMTIAGCLFTNAAAQGRVLINGSSANVQIEGCVLENAMVWIHDSGRCAVRDTYGYALGSSGEPAIRFTSEETSLERCILTQTAGSAPLVEIGSAAFGADGCLVEGCILLTNVGSGVLATGAHTGLRYVGNYLAEVTYGSGVAAGSGLSVGNGSGCVVSGNMVYRVGLTGIVVGTGTGCAVTGNMVLDDDFDGGQTVADRIMLLGIAVNGGSSHMVGDNVVRGMRFGGVSVAGSGCRVNGVVAAVDGNSSAYGVEVVGDNCVTGPLLVDTVDGIGLRVSGDNHVVTSVFVREVQEEGVVVTGDAAHLTSVMVRNAALEDESVGIDIVAKTATLPIRLTDCVVVFTASNDNVGIQASGHVDISGCEVRGAGVRMLKLLGTSTRFTVTGFHGIGPSWGASTGYGVELAGTSAVLQMSNSKVDMSAATASTGCLLAAGEAWLSNCVFIGNSSLGWGVATTKPLRMVNCLVDGYDSQGVFLGTAGSDSAISNCVFRNGNGASAAVLSAHSLRLEKCQIALTSTQLALIMSDVAAYAVVEGNVIDVPTTELSILNMENTGGSTIANNLFRAANGIATMGIDLHTTGSVVPNVILGNRWTGSSEATIANPHASDIPTDDFDDFNANFAARV